MAADLVFALTVLTRIAARCPEEASQLRRTLEKRLKRLAEPALEVALATGEPIGRVLTELLQSHGSFDVLSRIEDFCNRGEDQASVRLQQVAALVTWRLYDREHKNSLPPDEREPSSRARLARLTLNLGIRLARLGHNGDAYECAREAVRLFARLAEEDRVQYSGAYAQSLDHLGTRLADLGRFGEAVSAGQTAVAITRTATEATSAAARPVLASFLYNLGNHLAAAGLPLEALAATGESVDHFRDLQNLGEPTRGRLAGAFTSLAGQLLDLDRIDAAEQAAGSAVDCLHALDQGRPDLYRADFAKACDVHRGILQKLGRLEAAAEAAETSIRLYRDLVTIYPERFRAGLSASLNNAAALFESLGRLDEALAFCEEACAGIEQRLAAEPEVFRQHAATAAGTAGLILHRLGRYGAALERTRQAIALRRQAATEGQLDADLARDILNLGHQLRSVGQLADALKATREAALIYDQLAVANSRPFGYLQAVATDNLAALYLENGLLHPALASASRAVELASELHRRDERQYAAILASSSNQLGSILSMLERPAEAQPHFVRAVALYRELHLAKPDLEETATHLAGTLANLGTCEVSGGDLAAANEYLGEAEGLYQKLETSRPGRFLLEILSCLSARAHALDRSGQLAEALSLIEQAISQARASSHPRSARQLAHLLDQGGLMWLSQDRAEAALRCLAEAGEIYSQLAATRTGEWTIERADNLGNQAVALYELERIDDLLPVATLAVELYAATARATPNPDLRDLERVLANLERALAHDFDCATASSALEKIRTEIETLPNRGLTATYARMQARFQERCRPGNNV